MPIIDGKLHQSEEEEREAYAYTSDEAHHAAAHNEVGASAWLVSHNLFTRRERSQSEGGKSVHDKVHP